MKKIIPILLFSFFIISILSFLIFFKFFAPKSVVSYGVVPNFSFTERSGKSMQLSELDQNVWLADFIFTNCGGPCPIMSAQMAEIQKGLNGRDNVRLVSFSVDPKRDTPEKLTEYANQFGATDKWLFFTGKDEDIQNLAKKGFKLATGENPLIHSTRFILVDRNGKIYRYYDSEEEKVVKIILDDIFKLDNRH